MRQDEDDDETVAKHLEDIGSACLAKPGLFARKHQESRRRRAALMAKFSPWNFKQMLKLTCQLRYHSTTTQGTKMERIKLLSH